MRYAVTGEHIAFFEKNGFIEFDKLLSSTECAVLTSESARVIHSRNPETSKRPLSKTVTFIPKDTGDQCEATFLYGYNAAKESNNIQKILFSSKLTKIAGELVHKRELRFGFDQMLRGSDSKKMSQNAVLGFYHNDTLVFSEASCIRGLVIGVAICVSSPELQPQEERVGSEDEEHASIDIFPHETGNVIFFDATREVNVGSLWKRPHQNFILMLLAENPVQYIFQSKDPHVHLLKQEGYVFGDILGEKTHPTLYRRSGV